MSAMQDYKCPYCGGALEFNSAIQKMKCPFCDSEFEMETQIEQDAQSDAQSQASGGMQNLQGYDMSWDTQAGGQWESGETNGLRTYVCEACGGEIVGDENTGATSCPYCGSNIVMKGTFSGALKPDYIIPFKVDKKAAKAALLNHYKEKTFLPKVFKDQNHIDEIKGIYVPFWLFDANAYAEITYHTDRVHHTEDADYEYTITDHFAVERAGYLSFANIPVDGSTKIADDLMESIEPFDFSQAVPFQRAYLAGYIADKYDVDAQMSIERANERVKTSTEQAFRTTVNGYHTVIPENTAMQLQNGVAKYALYPVWILNTNWKGQKYTFAMNGQTGKFVGDLPVDKGAHKKWLFGLTGIFSAAAFAVSYLLWLL